MLPRSWFRYLNGGFTSGATRAVAAIPSAVNAEPDLRVDRPLRISKVVEALGLKRAQLKAGRDCSNDGHTQAKEFPTPRIVCVPHPKRGSECTGHCFEHERSVGGGKHIV